MITPAYAPTATERVLPRMELDFTAGSLDPRVTFARASIGTCVNSLGLVETMIADAPRFDYDPVTLAPKGLLIEEQRTNAITYSEDFGNVIWTKTNASVTTNATTAPSGSVTADALIEDTANSTHVVQYVASVPGTPTVFSFYAKKNGRNRVFFGGAGFSGQGFVAIFDLNTGTIVTNTGNKASMQAPSNGWYRCIVAFTPSAASGAAIFLCDDSNNITYTGDGTSGVYLWGFQSEAGAFATSYIPTTTTSLTRNADSVTMTGTNFSSWFNASEGAFNLWANVYSDTAPTMLELSKTGSGYAELFAMAREATLDRWQTEAVTGSVTQSVLNPATNTFTINANHKCVFAYKSASYAAAADGTAVATSAGSIPTGLDRLSIGHDLVGGGNFMNGYVQKLQYWPQRLINAEVQAFSK